MSDRHALTTGVAAIQFDFSPWADEDGNVTIDSIAPHVDEVVRAYLGGPAADEVLHGLSLEDNAGAAGDLDIVRGLLRDLGFSPEDAEAKIAKLYQEAKEPLTKPGVADKIRELTATREAGIPTTQHVSQDRLDQLSEDLGYGKKSGGNAGQSNAARGATANKGVRENVDTGTKGGGAKKSKVSNAATAAIAGGAIAAGIKSAKALSGTSQQLIPQPPSQVVPAPKKAKSIPEMLQDAAVQNNVPSDLIHAQAVQESKLNPTAVSPKGATGVMQLMPKTAEALGVDPGDPAQNIDGGVRLMADLRKRFHNDDSKALAAYNWTPDKVQGAIDTYGNDWLSHTPTETQHYVSTILANRDKAARGHDALTSVLSKNKALAKTFNPDNTVVIMAPSDRVDARKGTDEEDSQLEFWRPGDEGGPDFPRPKGYDDKTILEIYDPQLQTNPARLRDAIYGDLLHGMSADPYYNSLRDQFKDSFTPQELKRISSKQSWWDDANGAGVGKLPTIDAYIRGWLSPGEHDSATQGQKESKGTMYSPKQIEILEKMAHYIKTGEE